MPHVVSLYTHTTMEGEMSSFKQTLIRIEEIQRQIKEKEYFPYTPQILKSELNMLFNQHIDDIIQLAKLAEQMREDIDRSDGYLGPGAMEYDAFMKGG